MSKSTKGWLITAASLVVVGLTLFAVGMAAYHWDFSKLSTVTPQTNTHEIDEPFRSIDIRSDTADILFAASEDATCRVVCYEEEKQKHTVAVQDGALTIRVTDSRKWYDHIGFCFDSPKVTVYLPETAYASLNITETTGNVTIPQAFRFEDAAVSLQTGDVDLLASVSGCVTIHTTTGAVRVKDLTAGALTLSASTGDIAVSGVTCTGDIRADVTTGTVNLTAVTCRDLLSAGSTGNVTLKGMTADGKVSVERSTGDVKFDGSDAGEIFVRTTTGNVTGSLLSEKVFLPETSTGRIDVPKTATGGTCEIVTSTGDIRLTCADREEN